MRFLLDTHTLIWYLTDDTKLAKSLGNEIEHEDNACFVSIASLWEIGIKVSLGKLSLGMSLYDFFQIIQTSTFHILTIKPNHILQQLSLDQFHRDPFDRILIAQAQVENLTILTGDKAFVKYNVDIKWT